MVGRREVRCTCGLDLAGWVVWWNGALTLQARVSRRGSASLATLPSPAHSAQRAHAKRFYHICCSALLPRAVLDHPAGPSGLVVYSACWSRERVRVIRCAVSTLVVSAEIEARLPGDGRPGRLRLSHVAPCTPSPARLLALGCQPYRSYADGPVPRLSACCMAWLTSVPAYPPSASRRRTEP